MAESKIQKKVKIGAWESVSVPFTAPTDGFFKGYLRPSGGGLAHAVYSINDRDYMPNVFRVNSFSGFDEMGVIPVKKGDVIKLAASSGGTTLQAFCPIY